MPATSPRAKAHNRFLRLEAYEWYKSKGICVGCRTAYAEPGRVYCATCTRKRRVSAEKHDPGNAIHRQYNRERRERLKAAGLCIDCGANPAADGIVRCRMCQRKKVESGKMYRMRERFKREAERVREVRT